MSIYRELDEHNFGIKIIWDKYWVNSHFLLDYLTHVS